MATVAVACLGLYVGRDAIAEHIARDWLARHGIASHLQLRSISLTGLTASLRLGDAAHPDLTVDRVEVAYALSGPWNGRPLGVATRSLRLVRPRLNASLVDGRLSLGSLQTLVTEMLNRPPSGGPQPDVIIEDGALTLATPVGPLRAHGDATLHAGVLTSLEAAVDPFAITLQGVNVASRGGGLHLARQGDRLAGAVRLAALDLASDAWRVRAEDATLSARFPYPPPRGDIAGPVRLVLAARSIAATAQRARATGGSVSIDLDGALASTSARQAFAGRLLATGQFASIDPAMAHVAQAATRLDLAHLILTRDASGFAAAGDGLASLAVGQVGAGPAALSRVGGAARVHDLRLAVRDGRMTGSATLDGSLSGRGAVSDAQARRFAAAAPVLSSQPAYETALARSLRGFRFAATGLRIVVADNGARLRVSSAVRLDADSGARLTIAPGPGGVAVGPDGARGAASLALAGGGLPTLDGHIANGTLSGSRYQADLAVRGTLDAFDALGAAVQLGGHLTGDGARLRFDLAGCAPQSARRLALGASAVDRVSTRLCPAAAPFVEVGSNGWTVQGRLTDARGDVNDALADVRAATGAFRIDGGPGGLETAMLVLDRGEVVDASKPIRFQPVDLAGRIDLARGVWAGMFAATTSAGRAVGKIIVRADPTRGVGRVDIDASALAFASDALQPTDLAPLLNFARDANGPAAFKGWVTWGPGGRGASGGELVLRDVRFRSALGPLEGLNADLQFTSLSPLMTAPHQTIAIASVQAIVPLSDLSARFQLGQDALTIEDAASGIAKGRIRLEPVVVSLTPGSTLTGALAVERVNIGDIVAATSLADTVKLEAVVDGRIPFEMGPAGLTIHDGRLAAVAPGRISISRQALTGGADAKAKVSFGEDIAYQAMENLAFDQLDVVVNSLPDDRLGALFHIKGRHDPPVSQKGVIGLVDLLRGQALAKPILLPSGTGIDLTLDSSLNFGELIQALNRAWRDSTGAAGRSAPVQDQGPVIGAR